MREDERHKDEEREIITCTYTYCVRSVWMKVEVSVLWVACMLAVGTGGMLR